MFKFCSRSWQGETLGVLGKWLVPLRFCFYRFQLLICVVSTSTTETSFQDRILLFQRLFERSAIALIDRTMLVYSSEPNRRGVFDGQALM